MTLKTFSYSLSSICDTGVEGAGSARLMMRASSCPAASMMACASWGSNGIRSSSITVAAHKRSS